MDDWSIETVNQIKWLIETVNQIKKDEIFLPREELVSFMGGGDDAKLKTVERMGYGFNMRSNPLSLSEGNDLLLSRVQDASRVVLDKFPQLRHSPMPRRVAVLNLYVLIGSLAMDNYPRFIGAIQSSEWVLAAHEVWEIAKFQYIPKFRQKNMYHMLMFGEYPPEQS